MTLENLSIVALVGMIASMIGIAVWCFVFGYYFGWQAGLKKADEIKKSGATQ